MTRSKHTLILGTVAAGLMAEVFTGLREKAGTLIAKEGISCLLGAPGLCSLAEILAKAGGSIASSLGINLWAAKLTEVDDGLNHDLARASGRAIAAVIRRAAPRSGLQRKASEIEELAKAVEREHSPRFLDDAAGIGIPIDPALVVEDPAGFLGRIALDEQVWEEYLTRVASAAGVRADLIRSNVRAIGTALRDGYTEALYNELKSNAAGNGKAFGGTVLRMLVTVLRSLGELQQGLLAQHELTSSTVDATWRAVRSLRNELRIEPLITGIEALSTNLGEANEGIEGLRILLSRMPNQLDQLFALLTDLRRALPECGPAAQPLHQPNGPDPGFLYYDNVIAMVGRDEEAGALRAFLGAPVPVSWWLVHGPAGVGKSRLAYDLCLKATDEGWDAFFLDVELSKQRSWDRWIPTKSTLIVVDYVSSEIDRVSAWIAGLAQRESQLGASRVRFLLLERDTMSDWFDTLVRGRESTRTARTRTRHRDENGCVAPPLLLEPLREEAACAMFRAVEAGRFGRSATRIAIRSDAEIAEAVACLRANGVEFRPLFLLYSADAVFRGCDLRQWNQAQLSDYMLGQEREKWQKASRALHREADLRAHVNLLCLATIAGGLRLPERGYREVWKAIGAHDLTDAFPPASAFDCDHALISSMVSLGSDRGSNSIPALRPDYVGEFFALNHVAEKLRPIDTRRRLLSLAITLNPDGVRDFLVRASHDFPRHPVLHSFLLLLLANAETEGVSMPAPARHICLGWAAANLLPAGVWSLAERLLRSAQEHHAASRYNLAWLLRQFLGDAADPQGRSRKGLVEETESLLRNLIADDPIASMSDQDTKVVRDGILKSDTEAKTEGGPGDRARTAAIRVFESSQEVAQTHAMAVALLSELMIEMSEKGNADPRGRSAPTLLREAERLFRRKLALDPWNKEVRSGLLDLLQAFATGKLQDPEGRSPASLWPIVERMISEWRIACASDGAPMRAHGHFLLGLAQQPDCGELGVNCEREQLLAEGIEALEIALNRDWDDLQSCLALFPAYLELGGDVRAGEIAEHGLYLVGTRPTGANEVLLLLWSLVVLPPVRHHGILLRLARTLLQSQHRFLSLEHDKLLHAAAVRGSAMEAWIRTLCEVAKGGADLALLDQWPGWTHAATVVRTEEQEDTSIEEV